MSVTPQENAILTMMNEYQPAGTVSLESNQGAMNQPMMNEHYTGVMDQYGVDQAFDGIVQNYGISAETNHGFEAAVQSDERLKQLAQWSHDVTGQIAGVHRAQYLGERINTHAPEMAPHIQPPRQLGLFSRMIRFITGQAA